jgi:hypothetical protein
MTLPASDNFTGTNGTAVQVNNSGWGVNTSGMVIQSNALAGNTLNHDAFIYWNADAFNNDQYSQLTVVAVTANTYAGPAVRMAKSSTQTAYFLQGDSGDGLYLMKIVSSTETQLGSAGAVLAANDVLRLDVVGTTLTPKKNGSAVSPPGAQTDSSIASGAAGINIFNNSTGTLVDDWSADNYSAAAAGSLTVPRRTWRGNR